MTSFFVVRVAFAGGYEVLEAFLDIKAPSVRAHVEALEIPNEANVREGDVCCAIARRDVEANFDIKSIESVLTLVGGAVVYAAEEFASLAPPALPASPSWSPGNTYGGYQSVPVPHAHESCVVL